MVDHDKVVATLVLDIVEGKVIGVRSVTNPQKLEHLRHQVVRGDR
jgi:hypothetical protein